MGKESGAVLSPSAGFPRPANRWGRTTGPDTPPAGFGIADSTIHKWIKDANKNSNKIESRGSGNFSSDEAKEIARLRKELKDTQDALEVLKKAIGILGK